MKDDGTRDKLQRLLNEAPRREVQRHEKYVILSDLHMGDGGRNDDFLHNGYLCLEALQEYYLKKDYILILNGDIEELLRNPRPAIRKAWKAMYALFERFKADGRLIWLRGNHEILPSKAGDPEYNDHFDGESLLLETEHGRIFVFHGHQAGIANSGRYNGLIGWSLRFFANFLGIGNRTIAHDSEKKFKLEKAIYEFSRQEGLVSIIGHTHRPLFESLSKKESLGIRIERMCRDYTRADDSRRIAIRRTIRSLKADFLDTKTPEHHLSTSVYGKIPVPCVFNAGCAVGKRGLTTLEIKNGKIGLVFWSTLGRSRLPSAYNEYKPSLCYGTDSFRTILRRESLDYVFSRIELLGKG